MNKIRLSRLCWWPSSTRKQQLASIFLQCSAQIHLNVPIQSIALPKGDPVEAYLKTKQKYECKFYLIFLENILSVYLDNNVQLITLKILGYNSFIKSNIII